MGFLGDFFRKLFARTPLARIKQTQAARALPPAEASSIALDGPMAVWVEKHFPYYNSLAAAGKREFIYRLQQFTAQKTWQVLDPSLQECLPEIQAVVGGTAVMMTMNLPVVSYLEPFHTIAIGKRSYIDAETSTAEVGGIDEEKGIIGLSWEPVEAGFDDGGDGLNPAVHEMAHALRITHEEDPHDAGGLFNTKIKRQFDKVAEAELDRMRHNQNAFLRGYARVNEEEFFAVAMEHFFEQPHGFQQHLNKLYWLLVKLLNHNPADYVKEV